ncbi:unnamed protein product, partial [marine sediment metagenome]
GSPEEIEESEKGPDGVITGTLQFKPGKFGDGMFTDNVLNFATYDLRTDTTAGAVEIWFTIFDPLCFASCVRARS